MWLHVKEHKRVINLDNIKSIYTRPWGQAGGHLFIDYGDERKPWVAREFKKLEDAEGMLNSIVSALGGEGTKVYSI